MPFIDIAERVGMQKGLLAGIEVSLKVKLGEEGLEVIPELRALWDHELLQAVLHAIPEVATVDELRRVCPVGVGPAKGGERDSVRLERSRKRDDCHGCVAVGE